MARYLDGRDYICLERARNGTKCGRGLNIAGESRNEITRAVGSMHDANGACTTWLVACLAVGN